MHALIIEDESKDCPYLVPNPETRKPFVSIKRAWHTARKKAGLSDVRVHDLRHSAASFMVNANVPLFQVAEVLGHSGGGTAMTQRYAHLQNSTLLRAVELGAARMTGISTAE